jgi:hypothetical protein
LRGVGILVVVPFESNPLKIPPGVISNGAVLQA